MSTSKFEELMLSVSMQVDVSRLRSHSQWDNLYSRVLSTSQACSATWFGISTQYKLTLLEELRTLNAGNGAQLCHNEENIGGTEEDESVPVVIPVVTVCVVVALVIVGSIYHKIMKSTKVTPDKESSGVNEGQSQPRVSPQTHTQPDQSQALSQPTVHPVQQHQHVQPQYYQPQHQVQSQYVQQPQQYVQPQPQPQQQRIVQHQPVVMHAAPMPQNQPPVQIRLHQQVPNQQMPQQYVQHGQVQQPLYISQQGQMQQPQFLAQHGQMQQSHHFNTPPGNPVYIPLQGQHQQQRY